MTVKSKTKKSVPPAGTLYPNPPALISTLGKVGRANIFTAAWVSQICMTPPHIGLAIRPSRQSFRLIQESGEFAVNLPLASQVKEVDICGNISGRDSNKWELTGFTKQKPSKIKAPLILECPVSIECRVVNQIEVGTHVWFIAQVVARHEEKDFDPTKLLAYVSKDYMALGKEKLGSYGFSKTE